MRHEADIPLSSPGDRTPARAPIQIRHVARIHVDGATVHVHAIDHGMITIAIGDCSEAKMPSLLADVGMVVPQLPGESLAAAVARLSGQTIKMQEATRLMTRSAR